MIGTGLSWPAITHGAIGLLVCLIFAVPYGVTQERIRYHDGHPYDAEAYVQMAGQVARHEPLSTWKPYVYRVGLPWLVGILFPNDPMDGFRIVNVVAGALTLCVLWAFLMSFAPGPAMAITFFLFVANPNGPLRFSHFYPGFTDPPALLCILLIFFVHRRWPGVAPGTIVATSVLTLGGVMFRDMVLAAPAALWAAAWSDGRSSRDGLRLRLRALLSPWLLPIVVGVAGIALTHASVTPIGDYASLAGAMDSIQRNLSRHLQLPLAPFVCYGPILVLLVPYWRAAWTTLAGHRDLLVYLMLVAVLTLVGGLHTDRFVHWSFPVVLPLLAVAIGRLISERPSVYSTALIGSIVVAQVLAFRILGTIPNGTYDALVCPGRPSLWLFGPYGDDVNFAQMYAAYMDGWSRLILLSEYIGFAGWILGLHWLHRRRWPCAAPARRAITAED